MDKKCIDTFHVHCVMPRSVLYNRNWKYQQRFFFFTHTIAIIPYSLQIKVDTNNHINRSPPSCSTLIYFLKGLLSDNSPVFPSRARCDRAPLFQLKRGRLIAVLSPGVQFWNLSVRYRTINYWEYAFPTWNYYRSRKLNWIYLQRQRSFAMGQSTGDR